MARFRRWFLFFLALAAGCGSAWAGDIIIGGGTGDRTTDKPWCGG